MRLFLLLALCLPLFAFSQDSLTIQSRYIEAAMTVRERVLAANVEDLKKLMPLTEKLSAAGLSRLEQAEVISAANELYYQVLSKKKIKRKLAARFPEFPILATLSKGEIELLMVGEDLMDGGRISLI